MGTAVDRQWLGYVLICVLVVICLLANFLIPMLSVSAQQIQLPSLSIVIDLYWIGYMVWGIALIQPALLSIFLAYGRPPCLVRVPLGFVAFAIACGANMAGWLFANWKLPHDSIEIVAFIGLQAVGISVAMWATRIMRGWQLVSLNVREATVVRSVHRRELVIESVCLLLLVVAAIVLPDAIFETAGSGAGVMYSSALALVGAVIFAPIVFVCLRSSNFLFVNVLFLVSLVAAAAVVFGFIYFINSSGPEQLEYAGPMIGAVAGGGVLVGFLGALRLAGYQLRERPFFQVQAETGGVPRDPFED